MKRLTEKNPNGSITVRANEHELVERLFFYEDRLHSLFARREFARQQLRELRRAKKENTARYKELLGEELVSNSVLSAFDID